MLNIKERSNVMSTKICFTGGGSIGHVAVNLALIPYFQSQNYDCFYIGSHKGIEQEMIKELENVPYYPISSGKLRRYFDWKNFSDPFKVIKGLGDAYRILRKQKPALVFSKGGFVSVPVVMAARLLKIPVLLHESDVTPGLANKIAIRYADHIFTTFPQAAASLPKDKASVVGSIIRPELFQGQSQEGLAMTGLNHDKPIILIMGGSLGSQLLNQAVRQSLDSLLQSYHIVHLTGKGLVDPSFNQAGYVQYEFVTDALSHLLAASDYIVSRAGSNAIFEFLALKKPMLLIPLSKGASRGDQVLNAAYFQEVGYAQVLMEEDLTNEHFIQAINNLVASSPDILKAMNQYTHSYTIPDIYNMIIQHIK